MGGFFEMLHPNRHANASLRAKMEQTKQNEVSVKQTWNKYMYSSTKTYICFLLIYKSELKIKVQNTRALFNSFSLAGIIVSCLVRTQAACLGPFHLMIVFTQIKLSGEIIRQQFPQWKWVISSKRKGVSCCRQLPGNLGILRNKRWWRSVGPKSWKRKSYSVL